ncbi:MAG: hypothetical protein ACRD5H_14815 [Nitrososphaerales archaeon]
MGLVTTILAAAVAILGTTVYFLYSGNQLIRQLPESDSRNTNQAQQSQPQTAEEPLQEPPPAQSTVEGEPHMQEECSSLGIPYDQCTPVNILAKKRTFAGQPSGTQSQSIKVSNSHIWVATNNTSTAAMVVQNTGSTQGTITVMSIRGLAIPLSSVYLNTVDATTTNIQTELIADYSEYTVDADSDPAEEVFTLATSPITLYPGQAVIIYIDEPANIDAIDAGLSMTLNIQAGQASAVQSVVVVSQN